MALRVEVTDVDVVGATVNVFQGDKQVKQLNKTHDNIDTLSRVLSKWHKDKKFPKVPTPLGMFGSSLPDTKRGLQVYFDSVIAQMADSFPVKSFFRLYDLKGKVIIITGASSGIGKQNAYQLAEMGAHLILGCRSESKTLPIIADIKAKTGNEQVEYINLDLISLKSVNDFIEAFKAKALPLHMLINNAGTIVEGITDYGVDSTFGACHVGPFLLTVGLLDILKRTENSRIIFVASHLARKPKEMPWPRIRSKIALKYTNPTEAYGYAKLANVAAAKTLAKQMKGENNSNNSNNNGNNNNGNNNNNNPLVFSLHPGVVATDIWRMMNSFLASLIKNFMISEEEGSMMTLYLALAPGIEGESGQYYDYTGSYAPAPIIPLAENEDIQKQVWEESYKMCGLAQ